MSQYESLVHTLQQKFLDECQAHKLCADEVCGDNIRNVEKDLKIVDLI